MPTIGFCVLRLCVFLRFIRTTPDVCFMFFSSVLQNDSRCVFSHSSLARRTQMLFFLRFFRTTDVQPFAILDFAVASFCFVLQPLLDSGFCCCWILLRYATVAGFWILLLLDSASLCNRCWILDFALAGFCFVLQPLLDSAFCLLDSGFCSICDVLRERSVPTPLVSNPMAFNSTTVVSSRASIVTFRKRKLLSLQVTLFCRFRK